MSGIQIQRSRFLITGASSGIGRELAKKVAAEGGIVAVSARRRTWLDSLAEEIIQAGGVAPHVLPADLSHAGEARALAIRAQESLGQVDVLVNNAGGGVGGRIVAVGDREEAREAFEINYWSPLALISALAPPMIERNTGAIVNVTSLAQIGTWPGFGAYAATKAALATATETLRMEMLASRVHIMEVIPGPVDTAVQGETRLAPGIERMLSRLPLGSATRLAELVLRGLKRGQPRLIYPGLGRLGYLLPGVLRWDINRLARQAAKDIDPQVAEQLSSLVMRTGSLGDHAARQAREEWERNRGRTHQAH